MDYEQALISAKNGNAIIFFGAGFSSIQKGEDDSPLPTSRDLAKNLCKEIGMDVEESTDDLKDAAQYYLREKSPESLIVLLKQLFTVSTPSPTYTPITSITWRAIYTTNYDNLFEKSALNNGIEYVPVDMGSVPRDTTKVKRVIHINGFIDTVTPETLNTSFKLTNKSYLTEHFRQSAWSEVFRRDIESAHAIFFVGYSLYDLDIKEILFSNQDLHSKTFFIEREDMTEKEIQRSFISDFGTIKNIGIQKFAMDLESINPMILEDQNELIVTSFDNIKFSATDDSIQDTDVHNLLIIGKLMVDNLYTDFIAKHEKYLILRNALEDAINILNTKENLIIHSNLANGKTVMAKQVAAYFFNKGYQIYELKDDFLENYAYIEIEKILKRNSNTLFIVENYSEYLNIVRHINTSRHPETKLLLTSRSHEHHRCENELFFNKRIIDVSRSADIPIDKLTNADLEKIFDFLELYGFWGEVDLFSERAKFNFLKTKANSEFHGILLGLLKSPQVISRFNGFYDEMKKSSVLMDHIVAVLCLAITNISNPTFHMVSAITNSSAIFEPSLRANKVFQQILSANDGKLNAKSSVLAEFILTRFPNAVLLVNCIVQIAKNAHEKSQGNQLYFKFYKDLASFRYIQKILPDTGKRDSLILFYQGLKEIPRERENPHFWLQYAIARLSVPDKDNLDNAQRHLSHALQLARAKPGYWTDDIETQYARYYLENATRSFDLEEINNAMEEFSLGIGKILMVHKRDKYRKELYRPIALVKRFYTTHRNNLNPHHHLEIMGKCKELQAICKKDAAKFEDDIQFRRAKDNVDWVLREINLFLHIKDNEA